MTIPTGTTSRAGRHTTGYVGRYQVAADGELSSAEETEIEKQMVQLEADPEPSVSTALRWGRAQLDVVRRAAHLARHAVPDVLERSRIPLRARGPARRTRGRRRDPLKREPSTVTSRFDD
jgi:hypothetical protein